MPNNSDASSANAAKSAAAAGANNIQVSRVYNNQAYTANAATSQAANQALTGAESAASQPFQMPVAPVAGFNPTQQQAFGEVSAAQGQAQPYYNQAATDFQAGSTPISQSQINSYYNPMASNVTAQLQNIYGQQNQQKQPHEARIVLVQQGDRKKGNGGIKPTEEP